MDVVEALCQQAYKKETDSMFSGSLVAFKNPGDFFRLLNFFGLPLKKYKNFKFVYLRYYLENGISKDAAVKNVLLQNEYQIYLK